VECTRDATRYSGWQPRAVTIRRLNTGATYQSSAQIPSRPLRHRLTRSVTQHPLVGCNTFARHLAHGERHQVVPLCALNPPRPASGHRRSYLHRSFDDGLHEPGCVGTRRNRPAVSGSGLDLPGSPAISRAGRAEPPRRDVAEDGSSFVIRDDAAAWGAARRLRGALRDPSSTPDECGHRSQRSGTGLQRPDAGFRLELYRADALVNL